MCTRTRALCVSSGADKRWGAYPSANEHLPHLEELGHGVLLVRHVRLELELVCIAQEVSALQHVLHDMSPCDWACVRVSVAVLAKVAWTLAALPLLIDVY